LHFFAIKKKFAISQFFTIFRKIKKKFSLCRKKIFFASLRNLPRNLSDFERFGALLEQLDVLKMADNRDGVHRRE